jgi:filamentous hemagglutinin family protein
MRLLGRTMVRERANAFAKQTGVKVVIRHGAFLPRVATSASVLVLQPRPLRPLLAFRWLFATTTAVVASMVLSPFANAGPVGGTVVQGSAGISQSGAVTTINQSTNRAIINWQGFSIGKSETVNFNQPSSSSATLNRVTGSETSVIAGSLNANGQVFLVNPNGVLFSKGSQVNVGGLVASTLDISNANFMTGKYVFEGSSQASVVNQGRLHAHAGGYISLLGHTVVNDGVITATMGTVVMASGEKITLNFGGDSLLDVTIDKGTLNAMVANKRMIKADGGTVIMTAKAADQILAAQVNNSGVIQARSMASLRGGSGGTRVARTGKIKLLAQGGTVNVSGKLDASAPKGGNGGSIETSGDHVKIADSAVITTKAANGQNGTWLIDPTDFTIYNGPGNQTASGIGATTLLNELANGNVTIVTSASGTDSGDINVNAALDWSSTSATPSINSLTLASYNNININAPITWSAGTLTLNAGANVYVNAVMTATGTASFAANYGYQINADGSVSTTPTGAGNADNTPYGLYTLQGVSAAGTYTGKINFSGTGTVVLNGIQYTVIESAADLWGAPTKITDTSYYGYSYYYQSASPISASGHYVLGADFSANTIDTPGTGYTFSVSPTAASAIGTDTTPFTGNFNGFGHTINVNVGTYPVKGVTGLFGTIGAAGVVSNLNLNGAATSGVSTSASGAALGAIADVNYGSIINTAATNGQVNYGSVYLYNTVSVPGTATVTDVGGFVGDNYGAIINSWTAGGVAGSTNIGGFVGNNELGGSIYTSFVRLNTNTSGTAASSATAAYAGGFAGINSGLIEQSYTRAGVSLTTVDSNYNTIVIPNSIAAGFVGKNTSTGVIDQSYVNYGNLYGPESVTGAYIAGFVGDNAGKITNSYTLAPDYNNYGQITYTAGFAYINSGTISTSYAQLGSYNTHTYGFVDINNGGTTTNDYFFYRNNSNNPTSEPAGADNSTATYLVVSSTQDQSATVSNFTGFDTTIWGTEIYATPQTGFNTPILKQLPVLIELTSATSAPTYGTDSSQIVGSSSSNYLTAVGLQGFGSTKYSGVNPLNQFSLTTSSSGYLDAGVYLSGSVITATGVYSNITGVFSVSPKTLMLGSGVVNDKTYDGTTSATVNNSLANGGLVGLVGNQTLNINYQSATFGSQNAGTETATVVYTVSDGTNGGKASNYTISNSATATINPLTIGASFTAADKTYDGSANASVTTQLSGVLIGDTVGLNYTSALFSGANAAQGRTVTLSGLTLTNSNYALSATTITSTASIQPRVVDLYGSETAATSTSFSAANLYVKNAVPGDSVSLTGTVTLAGTSNGTQAITGVSGASLNNPNYTLTGATGKVLIGTATVALDQVVSGAVTISSSGSTTTVTETSNTADINWLRFSIAGNETVNFVQPSSTAVILNRVTGNEQSVIAGALNANGRVFIVNSSGVLFTSNSSVNAGALVATTQSIADTDFANGVYKFTQLAGGTGKVEADGSITVAANSFIALASGNGITVSGTLTVPGGKEILASANNLSLTLDTATPGATAYSLGGLLGVANVGGVLDVSNGAQPGGSIETAGGTVALTNSLSMTFGIGGVRLFSQNSDITVGAGGISAQFVDDALASGNFTLNSYQGAITINDAVTWTSNNMLTLAAGTNININNAITGSGNASGLTMSYGGYAQTHTTAAGTDYNINNQTIGYDGSITVGNGSVTLTGANASLNINGQAYTLIQTWAQLLSLPTNYIRDSSNSLLYDPNTFDFMTGTTGHYALGQDLTATSTLAGPAIPTFVGTLAGLGHKINNLTIVDTVGNGGDGLIGNIGVTGYSSNTFDLESVPGTVRDLGLANLSITGPGLAGSGGLAGQSGQGSTIKNAYVTGTISGCSDSTCTNQGDLMGQVGGLVGRNDGLIENAHVNITIRAPGAVEYIGGLVGWNYDHGLIDNSSATGSITVPGFAFADGGFEGSWAVGGLVGWNIGIIENSFANMTIVANTTTEIGGLVGLNYATGTTTGTAALINDRSAGSITTQWNATMAIETGSIGGLVGDNQGGTISGSSSTATITATAAYYDPNSGWANLNYIGGLVGKNEYSLYTGKGGTVTNSTYNGNITVTGLIDEVGGGIGYNDGSSTATGITTSGTITAFSGPGQTGTPGDLSNIIGGNSGSLGPWSSSMTVTLNGVPVGRTNPPPPNTGNNNNGSGNNPPTNESVASQAAAQSAALAASQTASAIAAAATMQASSSPTVGNFGAGGFNFAAPQKTDDNITFQQPAPGSVPAFGPSTTGTGSVDRRRSTASRGGRGNGSNLGATIRSIQVDGQRFDLQAPAPAPAPSGGGH